uniref:Uncharacterized protein n=1 Tax=Plectus sambesii TaxID=2011161 RepID=A0A914UYM5_9BILA
MCDDSHKGRSADCLSHHRSRRRQRRRPIAPISACNPPCLPWAINAAVSSPTRRTSACFIESGGRSLGGNRRSGDRKPRPSADGQNQHRSLSDTAFEARSPARVLVTSDYLAPSGHKTPAALVGQTTAARRSFVYWRRRPTTGDGASTEYIRVNLSTLLE